MALVSTDFANIQAAIDAAAAPGGGGEVVIPPGEHRSGPIVLPSNFTLTLHDGATVMFDDDPALYKPVWTRWEGVECWAMQPLIYIPSAENVTIKGKGTFDGAGQSWWHRLRDKRAAGQTGPIEPFELALAELNPGFETAADGGGGRKIQYLRPPLLQPYKSRNLKFEDFTLRNSPFWTLHPVYCQDIIIKNLHVENPADSHNTDAIDLDSCSRVLIEDCILDVGDDGVTIKSGSGPDGVRVGIPTTDVTVKNCTVYAAHGGVVIGSETAGGIENIKVDGCKFIGTERGIRLKTRRGRGGTIKNIEIRNIVADKVWCPITFNMYYRPGLKPEDKDFETLTSIEAQPVTPTTPHIDGVTIENVNATNVRSAAAFIVGLPEAPIKNVSITNFNYRLAPADQLLPTSEAAMTGGLFADDDRGIKVINAQAAFH